MVSCPNCGSTNPEAQKFCGECGTPLAATCPNGHTNPPTNKFCGECGTALEGERQPAEAESPVTGSAERRFVTVLFADLVGFTRFSESRDPEEVRSVLTRYFDRAREVIERFGGDVDKFIGDAVTAFWGATQAYEDDAERAVRAALELVDSVNALGEEVDISELAVRAGVLSGETSVGAGGNETGLVVGDIVNTASRLQSAARPGTVYVGEATKQLTEAALRYEPVGEQDLKGKTVPVTAWRAVSVVGERGGRGREGGLEPPFVGRSDELRLLKDRLHATSRDGTARLVSIIGEAGIGKSRLAWELLKYVDGLTEVFRWHEGRSPSYGDGVTFWALTEMVRSRAGITEAEEPLKARTKLSTTVAEFIPDPGEYQWIEPKLAGLLGLDDMPPGDRNELFAALRTFFQRIAEGDTTVLVFEDLQWADEGQLEFIEELVELSPRHPILVITLARPELLDRHPRWGAARHHFFSMRLGPLNDAEMSELLAGLAPGISDHTINLVVERAGGVPLYAVEYVRMLINTGDLVLEGTTYHETRELSDVALPESLHALVGARLDRLDAESRSLIQNAALLGQSFKVEGLTVLTGLSVEELEPKLRGLTHQELLRYETDPRSPERGQYQFVQGVIQEVAYGRISKTERRERHLEVAGYYEKQAPVDAAAVIASHYMNAYEARPDPELADKAQAALMRAAQRAAELRAAGQALGLVEQALEIPSSQRQRVELWEFAAPLASALLHHEEALGYARKAYEWYTEHGSPSDVVRGAHVLGTAYIDAEEPDEAVSAMEPHFDSERAKEPEMMALGAELSRAHMRNAQPEEAAEISVPVLIAAEAAGNTQIVIDALNTRGTVLRSLGRGYECLALLREVLRLAEANSLLEPTLRALNNLIVSETADGVSAWVDSAKKGFELAHRAMDEGQMIRMAVFYARVLFEHGSLEQALAVLDEVDPSEESDLRHYLTAGTEQIRWIQTGDRSHLERARQAIRTLLESHEPQYRQDAVAYEALISWLAGEPKKVLELASKVDPAAPRQEYLYPAIGASLRLGDPERVREIMSPDEMRPGRRFETLRWASKTALEVLEGDPDYAVTLFDDLITMIEEVEGPLMAAEWRALFAEAMPDRPEATAAAEEAYEWLTQVGANGYLDLYSHVWERQLGERTAVG